MGRMPGGYETSPKCYETPRIVDLGGLREITQTHDLFFGSAASHANNMAMSNPVGGQHGTTTVAGVTQGAPGGSGNAPTSLTSPGGVGAGSAGGAGGASGAGGGGAAGGAGGGGAHAELPFTGYNASAVAAIGSALSAAGVAIRRTLKRHER